MCGNHFAQYLSELSIHLDYWDKQLLFIRVSRRGLIKKASWKKRRYRRSLRSMDFM